MTFKKLEKWANNKHFQIHKYYRGPSFVNFTDKTIGINFRKKEKYRIFDLSHECGHILIRSKPSYKTNYPLSVKLQATDDSKIEKMKSFLIEEITEEIKAWEKGADLLKRLNIKFNPEEYKKYASECIFTYIQYAAK